MPSRMRTRLRRKLTNLVPHPRYGDQVIPSGANVDADEVRSSYWSYRIETIFPESAIPADISRQKFGAFPRGYYVDILKTCRKCRRGFLFFALEQRHWYEHLGFWIDADCVLCPECRVEHRQLRRRFRRYSERIGRSDLSDREFDTLLSDAVFLAEAGIIKDLQRLRRLRALARRSAPGCKAIETLSKFIERHQGA
jgi:Probable zinc-ribbon domain